MNFCIKTIHGQKLDGQAKALGPIKGEVVKWLDYSPIMVTARSGFDELFLVAFFKKNETQGTQMSVRLSVCLYVRPSRRFAVSVTLHAPV